MLAKSFWEEVYAKKPLSDIPWEYGRPVPQLVRAMRRVTAGRGKALDVCCGAGTQAIYLARHGFHVTGVDISENAISRAIKRGERAGVRVRFIAGDALNFLVGGREYDFILDRGGFHNISKGKRKEYVSGLFHTLKRGGRLMLFCFSARREKAWNHFTPAQIRRLFSPMFEMEECEEINGIPRSKGRRDLLYFLMKKA